MILRLNLPLISIICNLTEILEERQGQTGRGITHGNASMPREAAPAAQGSAGCSSQPRRGGWVGRAQDGTAGLQAPTGSATAHGQLGCSAPAAGPSQLYSDMGWQDPRHPGRERYFCSPC